MQNTLNGSGLHSAITIDENTTLQPAQSAGSTIIYRNLTINVATFVLDFLHITTVSFALMGELLHKIFERLEKYHLAPSPMIQNSWLGLPLIVSASMLSLLMQQINSHYKKQDTEKFLFTLFTGARFYYIYDLIFGAGKTNELPLSMFVIVSGIGIPSTAALFFKIASPNSIHQFIFNLDHLDDLNPPKYRDARLAERRINGFRTVVSAFFSSTAFLWNIDREVNGKTVSLKKWQHGLVILFLMMSYSIGLDATRHPKFKIGFFKFLTLMQTASLSYAAWSGIFGMAISFNCPNRDFCYDENTQEFLSYISFFLALSVGVYAAATRCENLESRHINNNKILEYFDKTSNALSNAGHSVMGNCSAAVKKTKRCFLSLWKKIPDENNNVTEDSEKEALIAKL